MNRVLFCDWNIGSDKYETGSLFEMTCLSAYDVVFFDPLTFATNSKLWTTKEDIWKTEYTSFSERELIQYLGKTKLASELINDFIFSGGILVIRSNFPKSYIRVRKLSEAGTGNNQYTESITSAFYWMDEFFGRFSCQYGIEHALRYLTPNNYIYRIFGQMPVEAAAAIILSQRENQLIIAEGGNYPHLPMIFRLTRETGPGEIYVIPQFLCKDEPQRLVEAFGAIAHEKKHGRFCPNWLNAFERKLTRVNPYNQDLIEIEEYIRRLERERRQAREKSADTAALLDMLYTSGDQLKLAVEKALYIAGFQFPATPAPIATAGFGLYLRDEYAANIVVDIYARPDQPLLPEDFDKSLDRLQSCRRDDQPVMIIVVNAPYELPPARRKAIFSPYVIAKSDEMGICLLSTPELFEIASTLLEHYGSPNIETMKKTVREDLLQNRGVFETDSRKYLAASTV